MTAFIFDLDGTLVNSLEDIGQACNQTLAAHGYPVHPMGILRAVRGSGGGYALAKAPADINIEEVFQHLEGEISPVRCLSKGRHCQREAQCSTRGFWTELDGHIRSFLHKRTLQEIIESEKCSVMGGNHGAAPPHGMAGICNATATASPGRELHSPGRQAGHCPARQ